MSEREHTPGPWVAHYLPQHRMRVTAYDETPLACSICDIALWNVDYGEQQANARLIAAAPDLLAALEGLLEEAGHYADRSDGTQSAILERAVGTARAAIALATQEESNDAG